MDNVLIFLIGLVFYTYVIRFFDDALGPYYMALPFERKLEEYLPQVTLVVPCFNEADFIEAKVANTRQLDYPADKFRWYSSRMALRTAA